MVATIATLGVIFAVSLLFLLRQQVALHRETRNTLHALLQRQGEIEAEHRATKAQLDKVQRENANARVVLQGALHCAQRAEEKATALQAAVLAVEDGPDEPPVH